MLKNRIATLRAQHGRRGVSKAQLARQIGVSRSYVTKLEKGRAQPSAEILFRLAEYFACRVEDVFQRATDVRASN